MFEKEPSSVLAVWLMLSYTSRILQINSVYMGDTESARVFQSHANVFKLGDINKKEQLRKMVYSSSLIAHFNFFIISSALKGSIFSV